MIKFSDFFQQNIVIEYVQETFLRHYQEQFNKKY